jgi:hypothetical protein
MHLILLNFVHYERLSSLWIVIVVVNCLALLLHQVISLYLIGIIVAPSWKSALSNIFSILVTFFGTAVGCYEGLLRWSLSASMVERLNTFLFRAAIVCVDVLFPPSIWSLCCRISPSWMGRVHLNHEKLFISPCVSFNPHICGGVCSYMPWARLKSASSDIAISSLWECCHNLTAFVGGPPSPVRKSHGFDINAKRCSFAVSFLLLLRVEIGGQGQRLFWLIQICCRARSLATSDDSKIGLRGIPGKQHLFSASYPKP